MIDVANVEIQARGRWYGILTSLGVPESYLTGKHGPCLFCQGIDRWRWDNKDNRGSYICGQCGAGSSFQLVMKHFGINFKEALKRVNEVLGGGFVKMDTVQNNKMSEADIKKMLNKIFSSSVPISGGDPVSKYLHSRKLILQPDNVRYCPECYHSNTKLHYTAMVARFVTKDGTPICLHRTYLQDNQKADIESNKKMTPTIQPMAGGAVRLFSPDNKMFESGVLGIGEGLESSIAAAQIFNIATWSTLSTSLMESFEPPPEIRKIVIFSDNDSSYTGQRSTYILANRLYKKDLVVSVEMPETIGYDWNDVLVEMAK